MGILIYIMMGAGLITVAVVAAMMRSKAMAATRFKITRPASPVQLTSTMMLSPQSKGTEEHPVVHAVDLTPEQVQAITEDVKLELDQIVEGMGQFSTQISVEPVPPGSDYYPGCIAFDILDLETQSGDINNIFTIVFYPESPPPNHDRLISFVRVKDVRGESPLAEFKTLTGTKILKRWNSQDDAEPYFMSWADVQAAREGLWEELADWALILEAIPGYTVSGIAGGNLPCSVILFRGRTSWSDRAHRRWRNAWDKWGEFVAKVVGTVAAFVGTIFTFGVGAPAFVAATVSLTQAIVKKVQDYGKTVAQAKAEALQEYNDAAAAIAKMLEYFSLGCTNPDNNDCYAIEKIRIFVSDKRPKTEGPHTEPQTPAGTPRKGTFRS